MPYQDRTGLVGEVQRRHAQGEALVRLYSSFQLHASSFVGAILVIAQGGRGAGRIQDSPLPSILGLTQVKFAIT